MIKLSNKVFQLTDAFVMNMFKKLKYNENFVYKT
jgi:hypothetical protein